MKKCLGMLLFVTMSCVASNNQRKHVEQERYYKKELPYAYDERSKRCLIIQSPQHDGHVHTIKRSQKTIQALYEQQRLQAATQLHK